MENEHVPVGFFRQTLLHLQTLVRHLRVPHERSGSGQLPRYSLAAADSLKNTDLSLSGLQQHDSALVVAVSMLMVWGLEEHAPLFPCLQLGNGQLVFTR